MTAVCLSLLKEYTNRSTPTQGAVIDEVERRVSSQFGETVDLPHRATAYRLLKALEKGRYTFGSAKARRSVADRPEGVLGRLRADRSGEYVVLDTNSLDVFAMEPVTGCWVPAQLTVAMDLFSRYILGLRVTPVSTKAVDVANVLFQCLEPQNDAGRSWPFHGVPHNVLVGTEQPDGVHRARAGDLPAVIPDTIVTDHGKQYMSADVIGACARLGICVQPAIPHKPTDKPSVERFFLTLRDSLLQHLTGYKGPDVCCRGKDVEQGSFYYVAELEQDHPRVGRDGLPPTAPSPAVRIASTTASRTRRPAGWSIVTATNGYATLEPHEIKLYHGDEFYWRQCHPSYLNDGVPSV